MNWWNIKGFDANIAFGWLQNGTYWDFPKWNLCISYFLAIKTVLTCRKHASELGKSLKWVDLDDLMKTVGQIQQNGGILGIKESKC